MRRARWTATNKTKKLLVWLECSQTDTIPQTIWAVKSPTVHQHLCLKLGSFNFGAIAKL